jgi:hypothetical protein
MTKFKRRYHATVPNDRYNARSVGAKLAASVLSKLDTVSEYSLPMEDELPEATLPIASGCRLFGMACERALCAAFDPEVGTGGLHYFHAQMPGNYVADVRSTLVEFGVSRR